MDMYFLLFSAKPSEDSPELQKIKPGYAHVWVKADSADQAEYLSLLYMEKHHLIPLTLELCYDSRELQIQDLGASESALYHRALQYGIGLDYIAAPVDQVDPLVGFRRLNHPSPDK